MRPLSFALLLAALSVTASGQGSPADPPYPRPTVDPTKDVKEPELPAPPEPERRKSAKERRAETVKKPKK